MKRILRPFTGLLAVILLIACVFPLAVHAAEVPDTSQANYIYLYNMDNDTVLYSKNTELHIYPGPTVKLMTALLAIEYFNGELDRQITLTKAMLAGVRGNNINLMEGEIVTVGDLLNAVIVGGANDAATVLATVISGSVEKFTDVMNQRALELGASHTYYTNPTGLHNANMYTTVSDIAVIAKYLYQYSLFKDIAKQTAYVMPATNLSSERHIYNKNFLIATNVEYKYYSPNVTGMNAGSTAEAGYCVVATTTYKGSSYLCIVMGAAKDENEYYNYSIARALFNWAYESFSLVTVIDAAEIICEIPVSMSAGIDHVTVLPENSLNVYLPTDIDVKKEVMRTWTLDKPSLTAPVEAGERVGTITLIYHDEVIGEIPLVTKSNVARSESLYLVSLIGAVIKSPITLRLMIVLIIAAIIYVFVSASMRYKRQKRAEAKKALQEQRRKSVPLAEGQGTVGKSENREESLSVSGSPGKRNATKANK